MIVDMHCHIGKRPHVSQSVEELIKKMDAAGIDKCVVYPQTRTVQNDYVAESAKKYPHRIIGLAMVNPWHQDKALDAIKRGVDKGLRGIKLHPYVDAFPLDDHLLVDPIFKLCEKMKIPIVCHGTGDNPYSMPLQFEEMARTFPGITLIMNHSGIEWAKDQAVRVAKRNDNIMLETSCAITSHVSRCVEEVGANRVLMGTDNPFNHFEVEIKKIEVSVPDVNKRKLVMGENALRIFG